MENKTILIIGAIVILICVLFVPLGREYNQYGYGGMMGMMYNYGGFGTMSLFGGLFMILLIVALILLIIWLVQQIEPASKRK